MKCQAEGLARIYRFRLHVPLQSRLCPDRCYCCCASQAPGDEPVWRQLLQFSLDHSVHAYPAGPQQAAAPAE